LCQKTWTFGRSMILRLIYDVLAFKTQSLSLFLSFPSPSPLPPLSLPYHLLFSTLHVYLFLPVFYSRLFSRNLSIFPSYFILLPTLCFCPSLSHSLLPMYEDVIGKHDACGLKRGHYFFRVEWKTTTSHTFFTSTFLSTTQKKTLISPFSPDFIF